jgi:antitoxin (DNA-binding transcriptional repressor) of toxin-antitoxin stability system
MSMKKTMVAGLRKDVKRYLDLIEAGETVRVYRRGEPVADLVPVSNGAPAWKREILRLSKKGLGLGQEIVKDREGGR